MIPNICYTRHWNPAIITLVCSLLLLSACGQTNNSSENALLLDNVTIGSPVDGYEIDDSISTEDMAAFILDGAGAIPEAVLDELLIYNANWSNMLGFKVAVAIITSEDDAADITATSSTIREELGLNSSDALIVVDYNRGAFITNYGADCILQDGSATFILSSLDEIATSIEKYFSDVHQLLLTGNASGADNEDYVAIGQSIADNFETYMVAIGYLVIDVTDLNVDSYPDATVQQAGGVGDLNLYCLSGSLTDAEQMWYQYYDNCYWNSTNDSFVQKWDSEDPSKPCSVEGIIDGTYYRAELVGETCVVAIALVEDGATALVQSIMAGIGVPENTSIPI